MTYTFVSSLQVRVAPPRQSAPCSSRAVRVRPPCAPLRRPVRMCAGPKDADTPSAQAAGTSASPPSPAAVGQKKPAAQAIGEEAEDLRTEREKEIDRLRAAEKFIEIDEGKYACPTCDYVYEPAKGEFLNSVKAGTQFEDLPQNFNCPACKTPKARFQRVKKTIAGFAENQQYGFGGNSMTAGQKNGIIFGGLVFFALLLLSGYALN